MNLLEVKNISREFGGVLAIDKVSFSVKSGTISSLIGPNGAGKTTLFNMITGIYQPTSGQVYYRNIEIQGIQPFKAARMGITRTFQNLQLFNHMTVLENVLVGCYTKTKSGLLASSLRLPQVRREERRAKEAALSCLDMVNLRYAANRPVDALSFGEQRLVEIARAMAMQPSLLLLDEPAAGLNTQEKVKLTDTINQIRETGVTVLLVEHDMDTVMTLSDQVVVLYLGRKLAEGTPDEIQSNKQVISAYLGGEAAC